MTLKEKIKVVEQAQNQYELMEASVKHHITFMPLPNMLFSSIAEKLYTTTIDRKTRYAVCDSDEKIHLVAYKEHEDLIDYCQSQNFNTLTLVERDGTGMMGKLEFFKRQ